MSVPDRVTVPGLVSAVIPVHNRAQMVVRAVESVLEQDYRPVEIVVVDDGSVDITPKVLATLQQRHGRQLRVVARGKSGGPGVAREAGRQAARGEFIQYLDSDDWLLPGKFSAQVTALRAMPRAALAYGHAEEHDESRPGRVRAVRQDAPRLEHAFPALLAGRPWQTFAPLYRREVLDMAGAWLPLWNEEDWEYDARVAALGMPVVCVDQFVGVYRRHGGTHLSGTPRRVRRARHHQAHARERIVAHALCAGVLPAAPEMQWAVRALFLLSRQCGSVGLQDDARRLFELGRSLSTQPNARDWGWYQTLAHAGGWRAASIVAGWRDRLWAALA